MNSPAKSNMYSVARNEVLEQFGAHVRPAADSCSFLFCVACGQMPGQEAVDALASSAQALGYEKVGCFFVTTRDLDPKELFQLIEGIDPLALVVADKEAAQALSLAYRTAQGPRVLQVGKHQCVLGRETVVFDSFEALLAQPGTKQKAWALLKKLPKIG